MDEQDDQQVPEVRECRKCDWVWGVAGVVFGGLIFVIGLDLLTGGALTRLVSGAKIAAVEPQGEHNDDT